MGRPLPLVITIVFVGLAMACAGGNAASKPEVVEVSARWASASASDVSTLTDSSDLVFIGTVEAISGQRYENAEVAGAPSSPIPGKPTPDLTRGFPITAFDVSISEVMAGDASAGDIVTLEQPGGLTRYADGRDVMLLLEGDQPIEVGVSYLFFVQMKPNGEYNSPPFGRFELNNGTFEAVGGFTSTGAAQSINGATASQIEARVEAAE